MGGETAWSRARRASVSPTPQAAAGAAEALQKMKCRKPESASDYIIFISISTPAGKFKLVSALIVRGVGFIISIMRLCTRISNCSRAFLCTKLERFTVYLWVSVGKGTGPTTSAPFRTAVSTICFTELSIIFAS